MRSRLSFRYLAVGAFNTAFGYGLFALLNYLFYGRYIYASLLANLIAITVAFLGYKWFVFKTKGNYLKEWIRCVGVYSSVSLFSLAALPILVTLLKRIVENPKLAPYIAGAILTGCTVVASFFGHKRFSFQYDETTAAIAEK
jgi:putative flippase GtrA